MTKLTEGAAHVIAGDITAVFQATDVALLTSARVVGSVLEGTADSGMHPRTKQKLLEALRDGFGKLLEGRREMVQAHTQMIVIQRQSNLDTVDFGCWGAPETIFTIAEKSRELAAASDA